MSIKSELKIDRSSLSRGNESFAYVTRSPYTELLYRGIL